MTVVPYTPTALPERASSLEVAARFAEAVSRTDFVPDALRGNAAAITAAILYGDEVGIPPMQALAKIAVINGRPTLSAEAQRALIAAAGHELWIEESTATRCIVAGRRRGSEQVSRITWTMDDAKRAGIAGKPTWRAYPRQMLLARASAELARAVFADAIGGLAAMEELDGTVPTPDGSPLIPTMPGEPTTRRRRARRTPEQPPHEPEVIASESQDESSTDDRPSPPAPVEVEDAAVQDAADEAASYPGSNPHSVPGTAADDDLGEITPMMTDAQRRKLMAHFNEQGFSERAHRLAFSSAMIGHRIESANELTQDEASRLIDILEEQSRRRIDG